MQIGIITDLKPSTKQIGYCGIKGGQGYSNQPNLGGYYNGAGAFMNYPTKSLCLYWQNSESKKIQNFDIRDEFKRRINNRRITQKIIKVFLELNKGKEIQLIWKDDMLQPQSLNNLDWNF